MKNFNKQIVEAVSRGIQLALDNFEDIEDNSSISGDVIVTNDIIGDKIDLMKDFVDLGLPSGTLWCKYNFGATCQPNDTKSWYGDYYAWGELTSDKPNGYSWDTYKFYEGPNFNHDNDTCYEYIKRYNCISKYNVNDELYQLQNEDDVVYQNMHIHNFKFHIPTKQQADELIENTKTIWVSDVSNRPEYKSANGYLGSGWFVISKINGNYIFFPDTGSKENKRLSLKNGSGVWTSNLSVGSIDSQIQCASCLQFEDHFLKNGTHHRIFGNWKYNGFPIRPVFNKNDQ